MNKRLVILLGAYCGLTANAYALPEVIDNSAYPPSAIPGNNIPASPSTNSLMEMTGRLEQLQTEVQQLTGKVEEQANTIAELKKQQKARLADLEDRLQTIENKSSAVADGGTAAPAEASAEAKPDAVAETASPAAAVAAAEASNNAPPAATAAPTPAPATPKPKVSEAEDKDYKAAYLALRSGHTDDSIAAFKNYLDTYPNSGLASNAQYWLGEAYLVNKNTDTAKQAFNTVLEKYPNSSKQPDALLMLGKIELEQKNNDKARDYFNQVTAKYPNTVAGRSAAKKLLMLDGGH
jgi:tol-pal system protein YbgF